ncbi:MAG TPA: tetratricopeptide repeat protein [Thermoanaerobaculia bacterium]|nr:tetratricopeptide repeat protein [Thermoanaerobaculia bacterium]
MQEPTEHPPREAFQRLVRSQASPEETRTLVRHLLEGCASCSQAAEEARRSPRELSYDAVFERLEQRLNEEVTGLLTERASAQNLYVELLGHQAVEGLTQVHGTRRYASLALCELLLQKSRERLLDDPDQARRATDLAVAVAEQLDLELYGAPVVQDTQAVAWAYFAETRRIQADLRTAESSMEKAGRLLAEGSGDPLTQAELLTLQASLRSYGGRFEEALGLLNQAASLYRRYGERHLLGRTLLKKGTVLGNAGKPDLAIRLIRRSMDLIEAPREPRLLVCATHNYIWFLSESDRRDQALSCLDGARRLYEQAGDRRDLGRLRWLEGKLAVGLGEAEGALLEARDGLAREGLAYEAALAAMDLAVRYAGERKAAAMRRHADQMLPLFRSEAMYRETMVALLSYQQDDGAEPGKLFEELGSYLDRARQEKNPPALARRLGP